MQDFQQSFTLAFELVRSGNAELLEIVLLSLKVSLSATLLACLIGLPVGALLATRQFPGKWLIATIVNTLMGMPPVVTGLLVYMLLSAAGPLGWLKLLYSPTAMIIAQTTLIAPIVAALSRQVIEDAWKEYRELFYSLCVSPARAAATLLWETRFSLITVLLAGFGRAISEVGAVIIVGGNIDHLTRVMTTAIALETSKGDLALALGLGLVLISIALAVNACVMGLRYRDDSRA